MTRVPLPGGELPVLREADVAVVGGPVAAVAAAARLATAGLRVVLLESGYALGEDVTAAYRPWLTVPDGGPDALPAVLRPLVGAEAEPGTEVPLVPARVKTSLEDTLFAAGAALLYGVRPLAPHTAGGALRGLVVAGKSGRQVVGCAVVLDATSGLYPPLSWTVEFTGVAEGAAGEIAATGRLPSGDPAVDGATGAVPARAPGPPARPDAGQDERRPGVAAGGPEPAGLTYGPGAGDALDAAVAAARWHRGYRGPGHLLAEFPVAGRAEALEAAGRLLRRHPAFRRADLGAVGHLPHGRRTVGRLAREATTPGVWALATDPVDSAAAAPPDPVATARQGERVGRELAARLSPPDGPTPRTPWPADAPEGPDIPQLPEVPQVPGAQRSAEPSELPEFLEVAEQPAPQRGRAYPRVTVAPLPVPVAHRVDVLVVGGGTAGASCAITAAREGARTLVTEAAPGLGGTGTYGGVHSYWFGRRTGHAADLQRRTHRAHRRLGLRGGVGRWHIEVKADALRRAVAEAGAEVRYDALAIAALRTGDRVRGAVLTGPEGPFAVLADVVVDATGDGDLAAWCGAPHTYGARGTHTVMWSSLARFEEPGATRNNFGGLADATNVEDATRAVLAARRRGGELHDHGAWPAYRETRHVEGDVTVTLTDQLTGRHWRDVVNLHFSNHDVKGKGEAVWPQLGLVPPNLEIELPYRALLPRGLEGLLVIGKALSATHDALAALRMQADLENLGAAAGIAAAWCARDRAVPRALDVSALQARLVSEGLLPAGLPAPQEAGTPPVAELLPELCRRLPLHAYSDMGRREVHRGGIPFVQLVLDRRAGTTAALAAALAHAAGPVRLALAQVLVCRGSDLGADVLVGHLRRALAGDALPARHARIREAQLPPDQSAMPDEAYLLYTLALARDRRTVPLWSRVAELVDASEEGLLDPLAGSFYWVDAVCAGAERLGDPAAVPALLGLHERPTLHGQWRHGGVEPDDFQERRAMLELALAGALARCGAARGTEVLAAYLDDCRALFAEQAHSRLVGLYGVDEGKDAARWLTRLAAHGPPAARPLPFADDPHAPDLPFPVGARHPSACRGAASPDTTRAG